MFYITNIVTFYHYGFCQTYIYIYIYIYIYLYFYDWCQMKYTHAYKGYRGVFRTLQNNFVKIKECQKEYWYIMKKNKHSKVLSGEGWYENLSIW